MMLGDFTTRVVAALARSRKPEVSIPGELPQQNLTGGSVDAYLYAVGEGSVTIEVLLPDKETALFQAPITIGSDGTAIPVTMRVPPNCWIVGVPSGSMTLSAVEFVTGL